MLRRSDCFMCLLLWLLQLETRDGYCWFVVVIRQIFRTGLKSPSPKPQIVFSRRLSLFEMWEWQQFDSTWCLLLGFEDCDGHFDILQFQNWLILSVLFHLDSWDEMWAGIHSQHKTNFIQLSPPFRSEEKEERVLSRANSPLSSLLLPVISTLR